MDWPLPRWVETGSESVPQRHLGSFGGTRQAQTQHHYNCGCLCSQLHRNYTGASFLLVFARILSLSKRGSRKWYPVGWKVPVDRRYIGNQPPSPSPGVIAQSMVACVRKNITLCLAHRAGATSSKTLAKFSQNLISRCTWTRETGILRQNFEKCAKRTANKRVWKHCKSYIQFVRHVGNDDLNHHFRHGAHSVYKIYSVLELFDLLFVLQIWHFWNFYSGDAHHANYGKHSLNHHFRHGAHSVYKIYSVLKLFDLLFLLHIWTASKYLLRWCASC